MADLITFNQLIILTFTNLLSGFFIGAGIAIGIYQILKRQMPAWIHAFRKEMIEEKAISTALEGRKRYGAF